LQIRHPRFESGRRLLRFTRCFSPKSAIGKVLGDSLCADGSVLPSHPVAATRPVSRSDCCAWCCAPTRLSSVPVAASTSGSGASTVSACRAFRAAVTSYNWAWAYRSIVRRLVECRANSWATLTDEPPATIWEMYVWRDYEVELPRLQNEIHDYAVVVKWLEGRSP
jgi:hypothetical protein